LRLDSGHAHRGTGQVDPGLTLGTRPASARRQLETRARLLTNGGIPSCPPPSAVDPFPLARMKPLRLFCTLLAFTAPFSAASAQYASVVDSSTDMISDGQPLHDNVLLYPIYGQLARNQVDGLLGSLKLWTRQQGVTCATNYTICQGSQFCCQSGSTCCTGELVRISQPTCLRTGRWRPPV
jgi:hypothetical protein